MRRCFPEKRRRSIARYVAIVGREGTALKDMQDCFGDLNDVTVHEKLTTGIAKASIERSARPSRRVFAAGLLTGHEEARFKPLLVAAEHAYRDFRKLKPYWR